MWKNRGLTTATGISYTDEMVGNIVRKIVFLINLLVVISLMPQNIWAAKSPFDVSGMNQKEIQQHFGQLTGKSIQVEGVVKDADDLMIASTPIIYEIPVYWRDGARFVKYGVVCQRKGDPTVIFADEGYLSLFVKKNVVNKPVLATGRLINGRQNNGLPNGVVFLIDSMKLKESADK